MWLMSVMSLRSALGPWGEGILIKVDNPGMLGGERKR